MDQKKEKQVAMQAIEQAIKDAIKKGFVIAVASDEEGNNWNELNPTKYAMFYNADELKPNAIALGVYRSLGEDEVFKEVILCKQCSWGQVEKEGDICKGCVDAKKERDDIKNNATPKA